MRLMMLAAFGGALGSAARYGVVLLAARQFGTEFPWGTFAVNVAGSLAIGGLMASLAQWFPGVPAVRVFLITGVLGGFTTFSAFSFDILSLLERRAVVQALFYAVGSVVISLLAAMLGYSAMKAIVQ
jgi:fluoride exporter